MSVGSKFVFWSVAALVLSAGPLGGQQPGKRAPQKSKGNVTIAKPKGTRVSAVLLPGQNVGGELDRSDPTLASDKTPYEVWSYAGTSGELLTVTMRSATADAYLMVMRESANGAEAIAEDDDGLGAGTTDAGLRVKLPADGAYLIVANSAAAPGPRFFFGQYRLEVVSSLSSSETTDWSALYPRGGGAGERYAVVVGISDYPGDGADLIGPRQDAAMFREVLISKYGFKEQNIVTLTDRNGSRDQIINAFRRFLSQAGPNGTVLFYYSGHGTQLDENIGLTGSDDPEEDGKDEAIYVWGNTAEEKGSLILDDELEILAGKLTAGRVLIVLDACYSGTGTRGGQGAPKLARLKDMKGLVDQPRAYIGAKGQKTGFPAGHILLSASSDKEVSWTASGWPTRGGLASVFTYYLVEAMYKAQPGTTIEELMVTVGDETNAYAKASYGKTQRPRAEGTRVGEALAAYLGE